MSDKEKNSWLEKNTFHHGEFWDILKLVEEKEKKGLKISLCIPTHAAMKAISTVKQEVAEAEKDEEELGNEREPLGELRTGWRV